MNSHEWCLESCFHDHRQHAQIHLYSHTCAIAHTPFSFHPLPGFIFLVIDWLIAKTVQKVIIVISNAATGTTVERWQFDIECDKSADASTVSSKSEADIHKEIQGIVRQITASVTFLPVIEEQCVFEVLMYTDKDTVIPNSWEESDPKYVDKAQEVFPLRSFNTNIHKVSAAVMFREE